MGTNIKTSLMPKGINKIIYNPGVSISTPRVRVNTLPLVPWGYYFFPVYYTACFVLLLEYIERGVVLIDMYMRLRKKRA
jgi:hypothetical protein